jgi:hypothetical protein
MMYLKNGGNIYALQQHLNHKSITTTELYLAFPTPDVWARILRSDATSRLLMKDYLISDVSIQTRLLENFAARGIAPERICLMGSTSREEHLAVYRRIDICLDPFPHSRGCFQLGSPAHGGASGGEAGQWFGEPSGRRHSVGDRNDGLDRHR